MMEILLRRAEGEEHGIPIAVLGLHKVCMARRLNGHIRFGIAVGQDRVAGRRLPRSVGDALLAIVSMWPYSVPPSAIIM